MNVVRPGLLSNIVYSGDAHRVWCDLKEGFDKINGAHMFQLHKKIHSLTQRTMLVTNYYTTLKAYGMSLTQLCLVQGALVLNL